MADVKPFFCVRPEPSVAHRVAALPYDVYNRAEAKAQACKDPLSFLNIDRPESNLPDDTDMYAPEVYQKARELLNEREADGTYLSDPQECYYLYELVMDGRSQTGIVACASIDDYQDGTIKKHENTRADKEEDRIRHVDACNAQTGPIFLAYRTQPEIARVMEKYRSQKPLYDFVAEDGIAHRVWRISNSEDISCLRAAFAGLKNLYIADGHHRAASAVRVGLNRRAQAASFEKTEEFNYFLSVLFPEDQLKILPYNRVVRDLNGNDEASFLEAVSKNFSVTLAGSKQVAPQEKGTFGMFLGEKWYLLRAKDTLRAETDPVKSLDVAVLQDYLLEPILGIKDPRTDKRIDFIGGIRGLSELERRVHTDMRVAFSMYPTSIQELFCVADAGLLMPPKSTWFEPKLRSGLFIHKLS